MRQAKVLYQDQLAGFLSETDEGYTFRYAERYLEIPGAKPVSLSLPLSKESYVDSKMLPFFDGLIPEGWLLDIALDNWKIDPRDRMGLLMVCCKDCIGAVSIEAIANGA